jgi:hypothetical protein
MIGNVSQNMIGEYNLLTQKSTTFYSLFLTDGQYVGSQLDRYFKLLLYIVSSSLHPPSWYARINHEIRNKANTLDLRLS